MTTATITKPPTAAGRFADEAEALGWTVERIRTDDGRRVVAVRGQERYQLDWCFNDRGNLVFAGGVYGGTEDDIEDAVNNVKATLRDMAQHRSPNGALLPFDPEDSTDEEVLAAVAGRQITWVTRFGLTETGYLPRGGMHLKITQGAADNGGARILNFPDQVHTGFRAVYLDQITKVK